MAEFAASPYCVRPNLWRYGAGKSSRLPLTAHFRTSRRKSSQIRSGYVRLSAPKTFGVGVFNINSKSIECRRRSSARCSCLGSLADLDGATAPDLVSVSDQLLLTVSIFLTYMAGVIPRQGYDSVSRKKEISDENVVTKSSSSGSTRKNDDQASRNCAWDEVKSKLLDSLDAMERRSNLGNKVLDFEQPHAKRPLSLYAVSEGPKLRLLWASFHQLEEEVNIALGDCKSITVDDWFKIFPEVIKRSSYPVCMAWLVEELHLQDNKSDEACISLISDKLEGDNTILQSIRKLGKEDLYVELLYFIKFGCLRMNSSFDSSLFILHGHSILEDMVINFADGIASIYLELISVDAKVSNAVNNLGGAILCSLSTRALQRLRNEVALSQWFYQNVEAIVSMYEDRFDLHTLELNVIEERSQDQSSENIRWWKKLILAKSRTSSPSVCYVTISPTSVPVKRTKELRALTGWRYYYSLYLELLDISMPLVRAIIDKVSSAISFFLVSLIGRSLGLIYTGIRQSLRWK